MTELTRTVLAPVSADAGASADLPSTPRVRAEEETQLPSTRSRGSWLLARTLVLATVAIVAASAVIFFSLHYLPGDQAAVLAGVDATPDQVDVIRAEMGLDRSVLVQYLDWLGSALTGDLGTSAFTGASVTAELVEKLAVTGPLALASLLLSVVVAVPLGMVAAVRRNDVLGRGVGALTQFGIAVPTFIVGLFLVITLALGTGWLPATGFPREGWGDPLTAARSLILPVLTLTIPQAAVLVRFVRSAVIDVVGQDYMRTARAQGLSATRALITHGLRNAALPLVSVLALEAAGLLMGTVIVEQVFALPGVGTMVLSDVSTRDITMVQGTLMILSTAVIVMMMLTDVLYQFLDPRVRRR